MSEPTRWAAISSAQVAAGEGGVEDVHLPRRTVEQDVVHELPVAADGLGADAGR